MKSKFDPKSILGGALSGAALMFAFGATTNQPPTESVNPATKTNKIQTQHVTGIGGVFFKAIDRKGLAAWYQTNLGILSHAGFADFTWRDQGHPEQTGHTSWALFPTNTAYFGSSSSPFMINYRVANLDRMLAQLGANGVKIEKVESSDYGRFAWIIDPEGNRVELWEPKRN